MSDYTPYTMNMEFLHFDHRGIQCIVNPYFELEARLFLDSERCFSLFSLLPVDTILALGGDGTFLHAVHLFPDMPILGIHFGTRGFLMNDREDILAATSLIHERFPLLEMSIFGEKYGHCVNEFVIKGIAGHVIEWHLRTGDIDIPIRADGCLISTSFGSTGYNASLGGPILIDSTVLVITPIAPLQPRQMNPLIVPLEQEVHLILQHRRKTEIGIYRDGEEIYRGSSFDLSDIMISHARHSGIRLVPTHLKNIKVSQFFS